MYIVCHVLRHDRSAVVQNTPPHPPPAWDFTSELAYLHKKEINMMTIDISFRSVLFILSVCVCVCSRTKHNQVDLI